MKKIVSDTSKKISQTISQTKPPRKSLALIIGLSVVIGLCIVLLPGKNRSNAVTKVTKGILPFGGRVTLVQYCCDGSVMLTITGKTNPGNYIFSPIASHPYRNFNIFTPGPNVVGDGNPGGYCQTTTSACYGGMYANTITRIGTSNF